jgi:hypothetical protein
VCQKWFLSLWYIRRKPCTYLASRLALSPNGLNELAVESHNLGVPSGVSKMISELMVRLVQTITLSCTDTNSISKWTETRFHRTHVTEGFHRVRPKQFLSLWNSYHKLCTYLMSRLALSLNGLKRASSWALSPRRTISCIQNDFLAYGTFSTNHGPIMHRH